jgi:hypothetical protein
MMFLLVNASKIKIYKFRRLKKLNQYFKKILKKKLKRSFSFLRVQNSYLEMYPTSMFRKKLETVNFLVLHP